MTMLTDLAIAVRNALHRPDVTIERLPLLDETPDRYVGDGTHYRTMLGARGRDITPLGRIIADTAAFLATPATQAATG